MRSRFLKFLAISRNFKRFENSYVNTAEMLRQAMSQEPNLKVMIANGYYDLATAFYATEYTVKLWAGIRP